MIFLCKHKYICIFQNKQRIEDLVEFREIQDSVPDMLTNL